MNKETTLGPLSSEGARESLLDQIARSVKAGATLVTGGSKLDREGFYMEPAILADIHSENPAYSEEFFGPVFLMFRVRDEEEAIRLANDSPFGLAAARFHLPLLLGLRDADDKTSLIVSARLLTY